MNPERKVPYMEDRQIFYNMAVPGIAFVFTAVILLSVLVLVNGNLPHSISSFGLILVILASFRMIRGVTYDKLLRYVREKFKYEKEVVIEDGKRFVIIKEVRPGWKKAICATIECPWCTGFWTTLITLFLYFVASWTWIIILIFAVSGVATFLQLLSNLVAAKYEEMDMRNEKMEKNGKL